MVLLSICLIFCQFQPDVAYKSVAYEKRVYFMFRKTFWIRQSIKKCEGKISIVSYSLEIVFGRAFCFNFMVDLSEGKAYQVTHENMVYAIVWDIV